MRFEVNLRTNCDSNGGLGDFIEIIHEPPAIKYSQVGT